MILTTRVMDYIRMHCTRRGYAASDVDGMYESWMILAPSDDMTQSRQMMLGYSLGFTHASLWSALQGFYLFFPGKAAVTFTRVPIRQLFSH